MKTLTVTPQRNWDDPKVVSDRRMFDKIGHHPHFKTGTYPLVKVLSDQEIYPFTDLSLRDVGPGLVNNRLEESTNGREWRVLRF